VGGTAQGSASIILNPKLIATDVHVVDRNCVGNKDFLFKHGYRNGRSLSAIHGTVVAVGNYCTADGARDPSQDIALGVLELDPATVEAEEARPKSGQALAPFELDGSDFAELRRKGSSFSVLGYINESLAPQFRDGEVPYIGRNCEFDTARLGLALHTCPNGRAASGGPIFYKPSNNSCRLAAIDAYEMGEAAFQVPYRSGINSNAAILASSFRDMAVKIADDLDRGMDAREIAGKLTGSPARQ
jgi:hypothetical protein